MVTFEGRLNRDLGGKDEAAAIAPGQQSSLGKHCATAVHRDVAAGWERTERIMRQAWRHACEGLNCCR
jgi:hypothetical protein